MKIQQLKIPVTISETKTLIRKDDGKRIEGKLIEFISFNSEGRGKDIHSSPEIGMSCIVDHFLGSYKWMTSSIKEIISDTEFKTNNSHYVIE